MATAVMMGDGPSLQQLQNAIQFGDIEKAKQIASQLAEQKTSLKIEPNLTESCELSNGEIRLKVYLEDKDSSGAFISWNVYPTTSVKQLKERLEEEQNIPQEVQKWIIGKRIRKDNESLASCGIRISGAAVYVYLLSASKVGLTQQEFENRKKSPQRRDEPVHQALQPPTEQMGELRLEYDFQQPARIQTVAHPVIPEEVLPSISQIGWQCDACTLLNEPTRPGCEMCGAERPAQYALPQGVKYKMSEKERLRLQKEQEDERLAREVNDAPLNEPLQVGQTNQENEPLAFLDDLPSIVQQELFKDAQNVAEMGPPPANLDASYVLQEERINRYYQSLEREPSNDEEEEDYYRN